MELMQKLAILADAAKYDASCASSGSIQKDAKGSDKGIGSTAGGMGICHSYAPDGRCISLLKVLLTNLCVYDCLYCINRHSSNVTRARFSVSEVVELTLGFYKRNYIEGLFLSSGVIRNPDYTMEQLVEVARSLREDHHFAGYIHLKTIPDADPRLQALAGLYADRLSINVEMPTQQGLSQLAPEKNHAAIRQSMYRLKEHIDEAKEGRQKVSKQHSDTKGLTKRSATNPLQFAPAGQSTQMIVGADDSSDATILHNSHRLYRSYGMRRVYYSAFSPIPDASANLPLQPPPLLREHRLYQADWLLRFYRFNVNELVSPDQQPMLDLDIDPKLAWALRNRADFPVDINRATREQLLRVPGLGPSGVQRIIDSRRFRRLRLADLKRMRLSLKKMKPFILAADYHPPNEKDNQHLRHQFSEQHATQMALF